MSNYFTISEFAKLRNININSLRYYEKIGVLKPAYVDERTGYRYYSPDQLPILNVILLCIDFGMPLKELTNYTSNGEFIQNKALFEKGKQIAEERISSLQAELHKIEYTLQYLSTNQQYSARTGAYERAIAERTIVTADYEGELTDIRRIEMESGKLYLYAQEKELSPVFPAGLLIRKESARTKVKIFFEVVGKDRSDEAVRILPAGDFLCRQVDLQPNNDLTEAIEDAFGEVGTDEIIVSNMLLDKYQIGIKKSELQKRISG